MVALSTWKKPAVPKTSKSQKVCFRFYDQLDSYFPGHHENGNSPALKRRTISILRVRGVGVQTPGGFARGGTVFRGLQPSEARPSRRAKRGSTERSERLRRVKRGRAKVIGRSPLQKNSKRFHSPESPGDSTYFGGEEEGVPFSEASSRAKRSEAPPSRRSEAVPPRVYNNYSWSHRAKRARLHRAKRGSTERSEAPPSKARLHRGSAERSEAARRSSGGRHYKKT